MRWTVTGAACLAVSFVLMGCPGGPVNHDPRPRYIHPPSMADAPTPTPAKASLPATYEGTIPCADCPGLRLTLAMWPDGVFYLRTAALSEVEAAGSDMSTYEIGRWVLTSDGTKLQLIGSADLPISFAVKSATRLRQLDNDDRELDSDRGSDLIRQSEFEWFEPRLRLDGMYLGGPDRGSLTECLTEREFPIASEAQRRRLDAEVQKAQAKRNVAVLATVEGRIVADQGGEAAGRHLIDIERVDHVWPGETCGRRFASISLEDTDWTLVRLRGQPVVQPIEGKEVHVRFRSDGRTLQGYVGCNHVRGRYELDKQRLRIVDLATTGMACDADMVTEERLLTGLSATATWKMRGSHLELYETDGTLIGRFEARPSTRP